VGDQWALVGLLPIMVILDLMASRIQDAAVHLRESLQLALRDGVTDLVCDSLDCCGHLCAAAGRFAEALTAWAAMSALKRHEKIQDMPVEARRRDKPLRRVRRALGPARARAAEERGAAMSAAAAAEYALMLADPGQPQPATSGQGRLSVRERELVALVAQGRSDAQIAADLYISIRTVRSHLDRIDKTGCRRRVDLTRLALSTAPV
jgi:DNA-binding CsgD family transcriptional regulator